MKEDCRSGEHSEPCSPNRSVGLGISRAFPEADAEIDLVDRSEGSDPSSFPHPHSQNTVTLDLTQLLSSDITESGSFHLGCTIWTTSLGKLLQALPIMAFLIDQSCNIAAANRVCERLGSDYEKIVGKPFASILSDLTESAKAEETVKEVFVTRQQRVLNAALGIKPIEIWGRITFRSIRLGTERLVMTLVEDLTIEQRQLLLEQKHNHALTTEISRRRAVERELVATEERYRRVVESANDSIYTTDDRGRFTYLNPVALNQSGYAVEELVGRPYYLLIHPDHVEEVIKWYSSQMAERTPQTYYEFPIVAKNGTTIWIGQNVQLLLKDAQITGVQAIARDITERKIAEERLKASLKEKEVLMREIHHRVKNNLQVISALFTLQADHVDEQKAVDVLRSANARIKAMALVHEKLYGSGNLAQIRIDEYVTDLVNDLIGFSDESTAKIALDIHVDKICFSLETAIPIGIIITELLGNTMTHGFPEGGGGTVQVRLRSLDRDLFELVIRDDGIGILGEMRPENSGSLGLELVAAFARKLQGEVRFDTSEHTEFSMIFKQAEVQGWS
ncbi:sensor histidine kinase [Desulfomonile tiedjei]|nr:PAS domain S-box protein [Desulfomonile tiedjei]